MQYFVKDGTIHVYPTVSSCTQRYTQERLFNSPPAGNRECQDCFTATSN